MTPRATVLVTGAEEHQGLAVIRGLGLAGHPVVACSGARGGLGVASRFAVARREVTPPTTDPQRFLDEVLDTARVTRPALIMPSIESTLVVLNEARDRVERLAPLAAPPSRVLEQALDKCRTLALARRVGVPVPRTAHGDSVDAILDACDALVFPVAIKPRGHWLHGATANSLGFKSRYARSRDELIALLARCRDDARAVLVQEFVPGRGRCVAAVCRDGVPLVLFAYERVREFPFSGGVSVVRRSIPLNDHLARYTTALLGELRWHGVAMVEFKYDERADRYTLMEINGRFQASTALSLDAGLNLPALTAALFLGEDPAPVGSYRVGVEERWLRGDVLALRDAFARASHRPPEGGFPGARPSRTAVAWRFLRDFRPGMHYDEFKWYDVRPGVVEAVALVRQVARWWGEVGAAVARYLATPVARRDADSSRACTNAATHRSMRA